MLRRCLLPASFGALLTIAAPAQGQTVEDLQRQINELKAIIAEMKAAQPVVAATATQAPAAQQAATAAPPTPPSIQARAQVAETRPVPPTPPASPRHWYDRLTLRGYTQLRVNEIMSGDRTAPAGVSRLRSVHDGGIGDDTGFTFRRIRLILQGDLSDRVSLYFQPDFATSVSNQSGGERREGFAQLRDAYVDAFLDADKQVRLRFGQSKVPFGWENMQSSSNRLTLDRSDAINSAVPSERDIGVVAYYTPPHVERIWARLTHDGQKLFGNYGAFGVGIFNGQGINRVETNDNVMTVAMATWPFDLGGLGAAFDGQVLELGGAVLRNRVQPELRAGGISPVGFRERRLGLHAILYPQPLGLQAEWNWGRDPEFDPLLGEIADRPLRGGYIQTMARVRHSPLGPFMPYARWQHYRGGWKALPNAPRLETDELELGIEFQPTPPLELTIAYARMERLEADERRTGIATGNLIRSQLQWNY